MIEDRLYTAGRAYARAEDIPVRHLRHIPRGWGTAGIGSTGKATTTYEDRSRIVLFGPRRDRNAGLVLAHELGHAAQRYAWMRANSRTTREIDAWRRAWRWMRANGFHITAADRGHAAEALMTYNRFGYEVVDYAAAVRAGDLGI